MSDWSMYELEDFVWEDFHGSDDHIVPRPSGEHAGHLAQGDSYKKPRHEVESTVGRIPVKNGCTSKYVLPKKEECASHSSLKDEKPPIKYSWSNASNDVCLVLCESEIVHEVTTFTSQEVKPSANCVIDPNTDRDGNELCSESSDNSICMNMSIADDNKLCNFLLDSISPSDANLNFQETQQQEREDSDLLDYEWPDMDNFEDVDRMFRNCDSTFGHGTSGTADETSWFSSPSLLIHVSEDCFKLGFQSSSSELNALKSSSTTTKNLLPRNDMLTNVCDNLSSLGYQPHANILDTDTETRGMYAPRKQVVQKLPKSQYQSEGKRKDWPSEYTGGRSLHGTDPVQKLEDKGCLSSEDLQSYTSSLDGHQKHFGGSDAMRQLHPYNQYVEPNHQSVEKLLDSPSAAKEKPKYLRHRRKLRNKLNPGNPSEPFICDSVFDYHASAQRKLDKSQNEEGGDNEMDENSFEIPGFDLDSAVIHESSCMASESSDNISRGLAIFRQLQDAMDLMDLRTKLCIRDGLYRLAKSAEHRHNFDSSNNEGRENRDSGRIRGMEESKSGGFIHVETGTNPIDRSIAHLLFYRTSKSSRSPDDAMSLESHTMNEQKHLPFNNLSVKPRDLVCQGDFGACTDRKLLPEEQ